MTPPLGVSLSTQKFIIVLLYYTDLGNEQIRERDIYIVVELFYDFFLFVRGGISKINKENKL